MHHTQFYKPWNLLNDMIFLALLHSGFKKIASGEIDKTLFISPKTVDHHISSMLFKLDVNSRAKAVQEAIRLGIIK